MEEDGFSWHLSGVTNNDLNHYVEGTACMSEDAVDAVVMAIKHQGLSDCYSTMYQHYYSQPNNLRHLIHSTQGGVAQLGIVNTI
jgi:hypothetical protein